MKIIGSFVLLMFCSIQLLLAQADYRSGFIIKMQGDTIHGEIDYRGDIMMGLVCKFKSPSGEVKEYTANDISAFRFLDNKFYVSKTIENHTFFLEYLINGKISIYYRRDELGDHYYIEKENVPLRELTYNSGFTEGERGQKVIYESTRHIGLLKLYTQDVPALNSMVENIKKPEHQNLVKMAEHYHYKVCKDQECIIYEKKQPKFRVMLEPSLGANYYKHLYGEDNKIYAELGFYTHFWLPRTNEKLYFRSGVIVNKVKTDIEDRLIYKIPLQVEYMFLKTRLSPKFATGVNLYKPYYVTVSYMAGLNLKMVSNVTLSINYDVDFVPSETVIIIPNKLFSHGITVGLLISFNHTK